MMLQILCMITMLIDHIGFIYNIPVMRFIGRFAAPIYAYFIVTGVFKTSDIKNYVFRLAFIGVAAQLPYMITFRTDILNICFTWCLSAVWIYFISNRHKCITRMFLLIFGFILALILPVEGSIYTYGLIVYVYITYYEKLQEDSIFTYRVIFWILCNTIMVCYIVRYDLVYYLVYFWAFFLVDLFHRKGYKRINSKYFKFLWRSFYPVHLMILAVISYNVYRGI